MPKVLFCFIVIFLVFLNCFNKVFAIDNPVKNILGVESQTLDILPTHEGPGFLRPSSPFYFLDNFKQRIGIFFSFTPEDKVLKYANTAGERSAELRLELLENNTKAAQTALSGMIINYGYAVKSLGDVKGANREKLAVELNDIIRQKNQMLYQIEEQLTEEDQYRIKEARSKLFANKIKAEAYLSPDLLKKEIIYDLQLVMKEDMSDVYGSAMKIKEVLGAYYDVKNSVDEQIKTDENLAVVTSAKVKELKDSRDESKKVLSQIEEMVKIVESLKIEVGQDN